MKIVIAPDSFKGSCTSIEAADAIERGINSVIPEARTVKIPMADGGEGTVEALIAGCGGNIHHTKVTPPVNNAVPEGLDADEQGKVKAAYGILPDGTAVMEMSAASGLTLVPHHLRDPMSATTYGTGELIKAALDSGCRKIIIGIGGSATNDGGAGMAQAIGFSLRDIEGREIGFGGGQLGRLHKIITANADKRLAETSITVACDVKNPLFGENGASAVYSPQKGATPEMVSILDSNLKHYAAVLKKSLGKDVAQVPGAGAAGGLGAGLMAFCNAVLTSGIETVIAASDFGNVIKDADLVITGEGRVDSQSAQGKVPYGIGRLALKSGVPVLLLAGSIGNGADSVYRTGITAIMSIMDSPMTLQEAMKDVLRLLEGAAARAMRMLEAGRLMRHT